MSHIATQWVWRQNLPPQQKLVLMRLADRANDEGHCWTKLSRIASECSMSIRTVQRHLRALEASKIVEVEERYRPNGSQRSNGYRLCVIPSPKPAKDVTPPLTPESDNDPLSPLEPPLNPVSKKQLLDTSALVWPPLPAGDLQQFLEILCQVEPSARQPLVDELAGALSSNVIKTNSARWFGSLVRSYHKGRFQPSLGLKVRQERLAPTVSCSKPQKMQPKPADIFKKASPSVGAESLKSIRQIMTGQRVPAAIDPLFTRVDKVGKGFIFVKKRHGLKEFFEKINSKLTGK